MVAENIVKYFIVEFFLIYINPAGTKSLFALNTQLQDPQKPSAYKKIFLIKNETAGTEANYIEKLQWRV